MKFTEEEKQRRSRHCRQMGIELTPDEWEKEFNEVMYGLIKAMEAKGYEDVNEDFVLTALDNLSEEERRKEEFELRMKKLIASLPKEVKPWTVVDRFGGVCKRYKSEEQAQRDCDDRNRRAREVGVEPCYNVKLGEV